MFFMHAMYGFGATVAPLVATEFVKKYPSQVTYFFAVSLGLALVDAAALVVVFRFRTEDQCVGPRAPEPLDPDTEAIDVPRQNQDSSSKFWDIMKTPTVQYLAIYLLIYVS